MTINKIEDTDLKNYDEENIEDQQLFEHFKIAADKNQTPLRVDKFLFEHLPNTTRNRIQMAAKEGFIHVNDKAVKSNYKIKPLDVLTVLLDRPHFETTIDPENIPLDIVFEDDYLMVINKPAGLVVHPGCGNYTGTLVNAIAWHLKDDPNYDPNDPSIGLVHRIDKDTSGLLVVAKTPEAKTKLGAQFFNKTTRRKYNALVWSNFEDNEGRIEGNIGRNKRNRLQMSVYDVDSNIGKSAVTHYKVLERYGYTTLVECILETGRTHQIRVHMKHIGHPLFNDTRYGGERILRGSKSSSYHQYIINCFKTCPRQALHAYTLGFKHPKTDKEMDFTAPYPTDFKELIERWRKYAKANAALK